MDAQYPKEIKNIEDGMLSRRRAKVGLWENTADKSSVGISLSGGGIRSAVQSLGIFQGLKKNGLVKNIDIMSTVSGGGYFGGFLGMAFDRSEVPQEAEKCLDNNGPAVKYLRNNGNYLAPNGGADFLSAAVVLLRNWASIFFILISTASVLFIFVRLLASLLGYPHIYLVKGIEVSYSVLVPIASLFISIIPLMWAYWISNSFLFWFLSAVAFLFGPIVSLSTGNYAYMSLSVLPVVSILWQRFAFSVDPVRVEEYINSLSSKFFVILFFGVLVAVTDSFGAFLYKSFYTWGLGGIGISGVSLITILSMPGKLSDSGILRKSLIPISITTIYLFAISFVSALSYWIAFDGAPISVMNVSNYDKAMSEVNNERLLVAFALSCVVSFVLGQGWKIINDTSISSLFSDRLNKSFLGATNSYRHSDGDSVASSHEDDDTMFTNYNPSLTGGPIHLINVVLNETIDGRSKLNQVSRSGINMCLGPAAISLGVRHHALIIRQESDKENMVLDPLLVNSSFKVFQPHDGQRYIRSEGLSLGKWLSVSAAAVSSGMGVSTSILSSLGLCLLNLRMGYWWDSGVGRSGSKILPVQQTFLKECLGLFPGTSEDRWHLSDGGHLDNTGGYELIRRRVPLIIICDHGYDIDYNFSSISNLIRLVRTDFDTEIEFLNNEALDRCLDSCVRGEFGTLEDINPNKPEWDSATVTNFSNGVKLNASFPKYSKAHAALAKIRYNDGSCGLMIYIKPSATGDEPLDVLSYHKAHKDFPNEPTHDQFFDESQWESYRAMSEHIADKIFSKNEKTEGKTPFEWLSNANSMTPAIPFPIR